MRSRARFPAAPGAQKLLLFDNHLQDPNWVCTQSGGIVQKLGHIQTALAAFNFCNKRPIANQIPLALNTLGPRIKPKFQIMWTSLGANLPNVTSQLGQIATGQISDVSAEFIMAIPDPALPGSFLGYPVLFTRGNDGVWRIYGM